MSTLLRREELRLRDVLAAIETIRSHLAVGEFDRKTSDAVLYNLVVIGEAAGQLGEETRSKAPQIAYRDLRPTERTYAEALSGFARREAWIGFPLIAAGSVLQILGVASS